MIIGPETSCPKPGAAMVGRLLDALERDHPALDRADHGLAVIAWPLVIASMVTLAVVLW